MSSAGEIYIKSVKKINGFMDYSGTTGTSSDSGEHHRACGNRTSMVFTAGMFPGIGPVIENEVPLRRGKSGQPRYNPDG
jgi:hypothetical protein